MYFLNFFIIKKSILTIVKKITKLKFQEILSFFVNECIRFYNYLKFNHKKECIDPTHN